MIYFILGLPDVKIKNIGEGTIIKGH